MAVLVLRRIGSRGRLRTCILPVQSRMRHQLRHSRSNLVREAGFEPASQGFKGPHATVAPFPNKLVRVGRIELPPPHSKCGSLPLTYTLLSGAHGRIRTPIFHPVTFVPVRSREGYVRKLEPPVGSDPASLG